MWSLYIGNKKMLTHSNRNVCLEHLSIWTATMVEDPSAKTLTGHWWNEETQSYEPGVRSYDIVRE